MKTTTIPLSEATKEQLRAFGRDYAGISFPGFTGEAKMRAKLAEAGYDEIKVKVESEEKPKATAAPKPKPAPKPAEEDEEDDAPAPKKPEQPLTAAEIVAGNAAKGEDPAVVRARIERDGAYINVMIQRQPGDGGDEPVTVAVNGKTLRIERGKPQLIRRPYYEALKNSEERHFDFREGDGATELTPRMVPSYPHSKV
jgi:hypothetical protein